MADSVRDFERKWDLMQQVLGAEARGDNFTGYRSTRTLFGIKSHAEEVIERVAAEETQRCEDKIASERGKDASKQAAAGAGERR